MGIIEELKSKLGLKPHPGEGGFFVETYRSAETLSLGDLGRSPAGRRSVGTAIYYLITPDSFSAMHRLTSDEIFHFYLGDPVEMLLLAPDGSGRTVLLGNRIMDGMSPQVVVPAHYWQGSRLQPGGQFALLGTTVAPGFDFADFEVGKRSLLAGAYPAFRDRIHQLTAGPA